MAIADDALVFTVDCPTHGARVLLGARRVRSLTNLADGTVELEWCCYCGATGRLRTGRSCRPGFGPDRTGSAVVPPTVTSEPDPASAA